MPLAKGPQMLNLSNRKESMQRIQVGLAGLTGVVLLIGLANVVVDNVRKDEAAMDPNGDLMTNMAVAAPVEEKPTEPLAELGVAPAPEKPAAQPPVVADLQPDPNLREPMDRAPPVTPTLPQDKQPADKPAQ